MKRHHPLPFSSMRHTALTRQRPAAQRGESQRLPLRTRTELAEDLGISKPTLRYAMESSGVPPPKPRMRNTSGLWYEPIEFRRWYKAHLAYVAPPKALDATAASAII